MYPHRIRLRGPWQCATEGGTPRRTTVPCNLPALGLANVPVVLIRTFGYPGRIDEQERVWLTLGELRGTAQLTLNTHFLAEIYDSSWAGDVTTLLGPRNQLQIATCGACVGEVALEVRACAFLAGVEVQRSGDNLHVTGTVAGMCATPLELYVRVDGKHVFYRVIHAGESFAVAFAEVGNSVRVELVNVATIWHVVDTPVHA
jgi:hypothetical protein